MAESGSSLRGKGMFDGLNHFCGDGKYLFQLSDSNVWGMLMCVLISLSYGNSQLFNAFLPYGLVYQIIKGKQK